MAPGVNGTDAVNLNQLNAVRFDLNTLNRKVEGVGAMAQANAGLTQPLTAGRANISGAIGVYGGSTAVSFGLGKLFSDGKSVARAGFTYIVESKTFGAHAGFGFDF